MTNLYGKVEVIYNSELDRLPASSELTEKKVAKTLDCDATIVRRDFNYLNADLWIRPKNTLYGRVNVIEPPLVVHKVKPEKDSLVRQKAPHINYGKSSSLAVGNTTEGILESYLNFSIQDIPRGKNIESAKIKLYPTGAIDNNFSIDINNASNRWGEYTIKYGYKPNKDNLITTKNIFVGDKVIEIDIIDYFNLWYTEQQNGYGELDCSFEIKNPYGEESLPPIITPLDDFGNKDDNNHKTFVFTPSSQEIGSMYFGSRESYSSPVLEITYYDIPPNADSYTLNADVQIAVNDESCLESVVDIYSRLVMSYIQSDVLFEKKKVSSTIECESYISLNDSSEIDGSITMENKNRKSELSSEMLLRAYREYFIDSNAEFEVKKVTNEINSDLILAVHSNSELDAEAIFAKKLIDSEILCELYIKGHNSSELNSEAIFENKNVESDMVADVVIAVHEASELDADFSMDKKNIASIIDVEFSIENKNATKDLDAIILIPAYGDSEIEAECIISIPLSSSIESEAALERKDIESVIEADCTMRAYGEGNIDVVFSMDKKEINSAIDADVSIRAYDEGLLNTDVNFMKKEVDSEIDSIAEIIKKAGTAEFDIDIILRAFWAEELECSVELGEGLEENDYAFII